MQISSLLIQMFFQLPTLEGDNCKLELCGPKLVEQTHDFPVNFQGRSPFINSS